MCYFGVYLLTTIEQAKQADNNTACLENNDKSKSDLLKTENFPKLSGWHDGIYLDYRQKTGFGDLLKMLVS